MLMKTEKRPIRQFQPTFSLSKSENTNFVVE
ncbi:MAG: hypothetical protein ACI923_002868 [Flavobacteriales bacterium]